MGADRVAAQPPEASSELDAEARKAFEAGRAAYDRGLFGKALAHFERAYQLSLRPRLLFNIARAADSDGQYERAVEAYKLYLERMQDAENREFAQSRLRKLRELSATREAASDGVQRESDAAAVKPSSSAPLPGAPSRADGAARFRLHAGPYLGLGGSARQESDLGAATADLEAGYGAQLGATYLPMRYVGVGAELRISTVRAKDDSSDRDLLTDILIKPSGRYPLSVLGLDLELHAALPLGLTIPSLSAAGSTGYGWSEKVGLALGLTTGASWFFTPSFGLDLELGAVWHWFEAEYQNPSETIGISFRTVQAMLALSFLYAPGRTP